MRLLCWIVAARRKFANAPIALQKIDIKSAYQRCHLNAITAVQTITQLPDEDLGIIMLCLTLGDAPCPFKWNILLESICDLANKILFDKDWNQLINYASSQHLAPAMALLDASIPFAEGAELIVEISIDPQGTGDIYINDLIQATVVIDGMDNATRCKCAILLAINICACPMHPNKPIPHKDIVHGTRFKQRQDWRSGKPSLDGYWTKGIFLCNFQKTSLLPGQTSSTQSFREEQQWPRKSRA